MTVNSIFFICIYAGVTWQLNAQDKDGFVLVKKEGSIAIYERWLTFPSSNPPVKAREVKGEFFFSNTIYAGLRLLKNEKTIKNWQSHVSEYKIYPHRDTTIWMEYSYHDIPWPVSDQDHFMEYKVTSPKAGQVLNISFRSRANETLAPVRKGVTRMQLAGSWTMEQISPGKVKVTYRILSKPIGIPKVFTDPIIRSNIMTTIEQYIALLEQ
ncbi:MAG: hypothetical protein C0490_05005 [Marivirga sp.]|nr:hypothetical protein [Marivirga sp.]